MTRTADLALAGWEIAARTLGDKATHGSAHRTARDFAQSGEVDAQRIAGLLPPARYPVLIDFGCGTGRVTRWLVDFYPKVIAVDGAPTMVETVRRNVPEALALPLDLIAPEATGDVAAVVALNVLTHVPKDDLPALVSRIGRWLRPGGRFAFNLPFAVEPGTLILPDEAMLPGGVNWWTHDEFHSDVIDAGPWIEGCLTPERPRDEWGLEHAPLSWLAVP